VAFALDTGTPRAAGSPKPWSTGDFTASRLEKPLRLSHLDYHGVATHFERVEHGLYRLTIRVPARRRPVRGTLCSQNRPDEPQAVASMSRPWCRDERVQLRVAALRRQAARFRHDPSSSGASSTKHGWPRRTSRNARPDLGDELSYRIGILIHARLAISLTTSWNYVAALVRILMPLGKLARIVSKCPFKCTFS